MYYETTLNSRIWSDIIKLIAIDSNIDIQLNISASQKNKYGKFLRARQKPT